MPSNPAQNMGRKVTLKPMNMSKKWAYARLSSYMRPVILGNQ